MAEVVGDSLSPRIYVYDPRRANLDVPVNVIHIEVEYSATEIPTEAFFNRRLVRKIDIPAGVEIVGKWVFYRCLSLKTIFFPASVRELGSYSLYNCTSLVSVDLPANLQTIENGLLGGCMSLKKVSVPSSVKTIKSLAFSQCSALVSLELPPSLGAVGNEAFIGCSSLVNVAFPPSLCKTERPRTLFRGSKRLEHQCSSGDNSEIITILKERFYNLPIHEICYYQVHSIEGKRQLEEAMLTDNVGMKQDSFGMTAFHILAISATPNFDMFRLLLGRFPAEALLLTDTWGSTAIDYLCQNANPESTAFLEEVLLHCYNGRISALSLEQWKMRINDLIQQIIECKVDEQTRMKHIQLVASKLEIYERMEVLSLLELFLWKMKIDSVPDNEDHPTDRASCRSLCGADIAIANIFPFLDAIGGAI